MNRTFVRSLCASALFIGMSQAGLAQQISFTDQEGREINLEKPAERVVAIPMPMASGVIAIDGGTDHLVGMNPASKTAITDGILGKIFPDAHQINDRVTAANFVPNVEELAAVDPDPSTPEFLGHGAGGAGACEGVEDYVARIGERINCTC